MTSDAVAPTNASRQAQMKELRDLVDTTRRLIALLRKDKYGDDPSLSRASIWLDFLNTVILYGGHAKVNGEDRPFAMGEFLDAAFFDHAEIMVREIQKLASEPGGIESGDLSVSLHNLQQFISSVVTELQRKINDIDDKNLRFEANTALFSVRSALESARAGENVYSSAELAEEARTRASKAADDADESAVHVREVAGEEAVGELANHFGDYARSERKAANIWRVIAVVTLLAISGAAVWLLNLPATGDIGLLLRRALVTIPLGVLAGYAIHESSQHRMAARWGQTITVQLRTFKAFSDPLPDDVRNSIRAHFGLAVFSVWPAAAGGNVTRATNANESANELMPKQLVPLLEQALSLVRKQ
jgi:hypothetical protein